MAIVSRGFELSAELKDLPPGDVTEKRTPAYSIWKSSTGGVLLLAGLALTPIWIGLLGWIAYELVLALGG